MVIKETIKLIDGTEQEVELIKPSFPKRNELIKKNIKFGATASGQIDIKEADLLGLMTDLVKESLQNFDINKLDDGEGDRIYNKYFSEILSGLGGQGNSQETSE